VGRSGCETGAASWSEQGSLGFLSQLGLNTGGFDIIVDRQPRSGVTGRLATSVNLVEDGVRVLNWSWGIHRVGSVSIDGNRVQANVRSSLAFDGYEKLVERFFFWLKHHHPNVVVVNSAGNSFSTIDAQDNRLPSAFRSDQLLVVGGHQLSGRNVDVRDARFVVRRGTSNVGRRVDITATACVRNPFARGASACGTSYAAALVTGVVAAMLSINPALEPRLIRVLLRQSALPMAGGRSTGSAAIEPTLPLQPGERLNETESSIVQYARLDMHHALVLALKSLAAPAVVSTQRSPSER